MDRLLNLKEYRSEEHELDRSTVQALFARRDLELDISPGIDPNLWRIRPAAKVGVTWVQGIRVLLEPKLDVQNVLALMGLEKDPASWGPDTAPYEANVDLLVALVRMYGQTLTRALARGIRREYRVQHERLHGVRGRIDMRANAHNPFVDSLVPCIFDEFTADTDLNRVLLAGLQRGLRFLDLPARDRRRLRWLTAGFEEVSTEPDPIRIGESWRSTRLDRHFKLPLQVALVLLRNSSLGLGDGLGQGATFLIDMNRVVQDFIAETLNALLPAPMTLTPEDPTPLDRASRKIVSPDLVFHDRYGPAFVADVKYKDVVSASKVSIDDIYQLSTYMSVLRLQRGALITCTAGQVPDHPDFIDVRNVGRLEIWPIDLTAPVNEIRRSVAVLANRISEYAGASAIA